jgi:hypothetical protein
LVKEKRAIFRQQLDTAARADSIGGVERACHHAKEADMTPWKILVDAVGGAALAFLLLVVLVVDRLLSPGERAVANTLEVRVVTDGSKTPTQRKLRLAVLSDPVRNPKDNAEVIWDDMSSLLNQLGAGYQHDHLRTGDLLADPRRLDKYDVLFYTCSPGGQELRDTLVQFVSRGGILYASDWRYDAIANAFPDLVDQGSRGDGLNGSVMAEVVDPGLRDILGPATELNFDLPQWKTAAFAGPRVNVLLRGNYRRMRNANDGVGVPASAPLLVCFPVGRGGQVIFTSFHNEKLARDTEQKLLQYLVFTMVTAGVEADLQSQFAEGGFAPERSNLLSTPRNNPSMIKSFAHPKAGPLRIALGFRDEGAKLKLRIAAPDGRSYTWEGGSTVVLEVPNAMAGEWSYRVTALHLPYENFPFLVTIGQKR